MFERGRFSERAYRVIIFARDECCPDGPHPIRAEHVLLGLLRADPELFAQLLPVGAGAAGSIRSALGEFSPRRRQSWMAASPPPFSLSAREVLLRAEEERSRLGREHICTEHLLLGLLTCRETWLWGLIKVGSSRVSRVLKSSGLKPEEVRRRVTAQSITPQSRPAGPGPRLGLLVQPGEHIRFDRAGATS